MNWLRRRSPATLYTAFLIAFLLFRAILFAITTAGEYRLYRDYGDAARHTSLAELYRTRDIEYPHLGVAFGSVAGVVADIAPDWTKHLVRRRPNKFDERDQYQLESEAERDVGDRYEAALGFVLFAVDVWCLWLVHVIARRVYPNEDHVTHVGRLAGYALTTGALGLILYDRQDLVVGLLALLALWALAAGRPRAGYALLVVGTAYKLVPVLLLPVWVMAAAAVKAAPDATPVRFLRHMVMEAAIAGLMLAAWPALTYWFGGGERGFLFLTFHSARGLQLEAPVAWPVLLIEPSTEVGHGHGSYNLRGELADRVAKPTKVLMPLTVLAGVVIAARGFWNAARARVCQDHSAHSPQPSALIPHVVASSLLVWLGFIAANKVGSPQYLIWAAPLVPLLPLRRWPERAWAILLLVVMILTTLIFPCRYYPDLIGSVVRDEPLTWRGPTWLGLFLLAAKSVTLFVTTGWLAASVWRTPRTGAPGGLRAPRPSEPLP